MNLRDAMSRIQTIQAALSITEPETLAIKRAYRYFPKSSQAIPDVDTPCFINQWTAPGMPFGAGLLLGDFTVHMQLLVLNPDTERAADIATAFYPKIVTAFAQNIKLGESSPVWVKTLRGGDPTLATIEFAGKLYVGLDLFLDIGISRSQAMEP